MRVIIGSVLLFIFSLSNGQIRKEKDFYTNGKIQASGRILTCAGYSSNYQCTDIKCRKIGKWLYFYQAGGIERIENYKKLKDCRSDAIPHGFWFYYDQSGNLIRKEEYREGILWIADILKLYAGDDQVGEIIIRHGIMDTVMAESWAPDSLNLIKNGGFDLYYNGPALQIMDGQKRIEKQIPFWYTPNSNTPDYYNPYRKFRNVPDNFIHAYNEPYSHVGIILYHDPTGSYSEYITGELYKHLRADKEYCFKIRIRLSQNAGYSIDQFGVLFSNQIPSLPNTFLKQEVLPQLNFTKNLDNRDDWVTLCSSFRAAGGEAFVSIGRFSSVDETGIHGIQALNPSEGEFNQSAYYLIDQIELFEDVSGCGCDRITRRIDRKQRTDFGILSPGDSLILEPEAIYVLRNVFFDFDKSDLLPASRMELLKLYDFLETHPVSIKIMGHTDAIGSDDYNLKLSQARAKAVADWLVNQGLDPARLQYEGFGDRSPMVPNTSSENRALNRRVEFSVKESEGP